MQSYIQARFVIAFQNISHQEIKKVSASKMNLFEIYIYKASATSDISSLTLYGEIRANSGKRSFKKVSGLSNQTILDLKWYIF